MNQIVEKLPNSEFSTLKGMNETAKHIYNSVAAFLIETCQFLKGYFYNPEFSKINLVNNFSFKCN